MKQEPSAKLETNNETRSEFQSLLQNLWIITTVTTAGFLLIFNIIERHKEAIDHAEQIHETVRISLQTPLTNAQRDGLIRNFAKSKREDIQVGLNMAIAVNQQGKIVFSSRQGWNNLDITDRLVNGLENDDPEFRSLVRCFAGKKDRCTETISDDLQAKTGSFTYIRPLEGYREKKDSDPEQISLIINYDPGAIFYGFELDTTLIIAIAMLLASGQTLLVRALIKKQLLPALVRNAKTDTLTQLPNRAIFMEEAKELLAEAETRSGEMTLAILDIDHFKSINDTYGHTCGDKALTHLSEILRAVMRPNDIVCRFGGEEFALLLDGSHHDAGVALERLRLQLEMASFKFKNRQIKLTVSIGAATTSNFGYNIDYLFTTADKALYAAKDSGRNRLEWGNSQIVSRLSR